LIDGVVWVWASLAGRGKKADTRGKNGKTSEVSHPTDGEVKISEVISPSSYALEIYVPQREIIDCKLRDFKRKTTNL
jgi:hypothetical protein